jgi:hypothetical protein
VRTDCQSEVSEVSPIDLSAWASLPQLPTLRPHALREEQMRGSKRPKPGGKWELRVPRPPHPLTGARREMSRTVTASEREADLLLAQLVVEVSREHTPTTSVDLAMLHERWINHLRSRGRAPSTITSYEARWRVVAEYIGHRSLADLTAATLDHLYDELLRAGKGTATVSKVHVQLKSMLGQARKWSLIDTNPAELATPPSRQGLPFAPLVDRLDFITKKANWGGSMRRTTIGICDADFALIAAAFRTYAQKSEA